jgi:hypothetical protein
MNYRCLLLIPAICALAACGSMEGQFPSLAKRPYETTTPPSEPVIVARPTARQLPKSLAIQVNSIEARFNTARADFAALLRSTRATANSAAGSSIGSEAWVNAQLVVSRLDNARAQAVLAEAEIDALLSRQLDTESVDQNALLSPLIAPVQRRIANEVDAQNEELDRLARQIGI